jgi:hypothetical protein
MLNCKNVQPNIEEACNSPIDKSIKEDNKNISDYDKCFLYEDNEDCQKEDNLLKEKGVNEFPLFSKLKNSTDLNITDKNLHKFLGEDLINALNNDLVDPEENSDSSDSNISNGYITGSSECTSKSNSPEFSLKFPKIEKDINMSLNLESILKQNENDNDLDDIKEKIKFLNDPSFTPMIIPPKMNEKLEEEIIKKEFKGNDQKDEKKETKNNPLKNKFDDNVEPLIMPSMLNKEVKTKLPLEIRAGDWICNFCNNLNFSFRVKCNRCGLLRKSTSHIIRYNYINNKYQYMGNYDNYNDGYFY